MLSYVIGCLRKDKNALNKEINVDFSLYCLNSMLNMVPGSRPGLGTVCCGLERVTFTLCLVLIRTNCDEAGDYVVPNVSKGPRLQT